MYIEKTASGYDSGGQQVSRRARFLILVQTDGDKEIRALVRKVALHQFGHFMMGSARAFGHRIPISGSYGSDGLPCTVPQEVFDKAVPIPEELHKAWNEGGGWNGAGSEALLMQKWALENIEQLQPRG